MTNSEEKNQADEVPKQKKQKTDTPAEGWPQPQTEDEMAELADQQPPKEQGEMEPTIKPDLTLPESEAEIEEMPETGQAEREEIEEQGEASASEAEPAEKKPRPSRPVGKKMVGLPEEAEAEKRWYVIHAHSGHENKVKQTLETKVKQEHLEELVSQIIVPTEEVAEVKGGKKRITSRKIFPGYVLVEMKLTHKTWYFIRTTAGVTGFIGSGPMPTALEPEEVESIFQQMRGEQKKPKPKMIFEKDDKVKIIEGPFTNFMGFVDEVNPERGKLKVMVEIFERLTPVELEFWQVEKV
jgi:transcriptional antiterminator NusG